jgi:hypothetical protein
MADAPFAEIRQQDRLLALILKASYDRPGLNFLTPQDLSLQLGYMTHPAGKKIAPHVHNPVKREISQTLEAVFVKKGRVRIDIYDDRRQPVASRELGAGDLVLFCGGGHGLEMLEETSLIEIKQGPYLGAQDKTRW